MRALLQRVSKASVHVDGRVVGEIGRGFVVLLGITHTDTAAEARWLADKVARLRLFEDGQEKMNIGLDEIGGEILLVSQFTLYGDARKGRRPSFSDAALPEQAEPLINVFAERIRTRGIKVESGIFGAHMEVEIHNDGPVTMLIERESKQQ